MTLPLRHNNPTIDGTDPPAQGVAEAERRQKAYAESRKAWAERVGRPYQDALDVRHPPGELDAEPDE